MAAISDGGVDRADRHPRATSGLCRDGARLHTRSFVSHHGRRRTEIDEATGVVRWLLEAGLSGLGLTKTHALRRTTPDAPDEGVATADVPLAELDVHLGQRIGYVFDFGDEWRVRPVRERVTAEPGDHPRVLELRGSPPPQYASLDERTS